MSRERLSEIIDLREQDKLNSARGERADLNAMRLVLATCDPAVVDMADEYWGQVLDMADEIGIDSALEKVGELDPEGCGAAMAIEAEADRVAATLLSD